MFQRFIALAGITTLTALGFTSALGACSSSDEPSTEHDVDAGADTGVDAEADGGHRPIDAAPEPDAEPEACGPTGGTRTAADVDEQVGWKPPLAPQQACTPEDLTAIKKAFTNSQSLTSYKQIVADTSDTCKACVLTPKEADHWGPLVAFNAAATSGIFNYGACYATLDTEACGRSTELLSVCLNGACSKCTTQSEAEACYLAGQDDQCKPIFDDYLSTCTNAEAPTKCRQQLDAITILCASGANDD